MEREERAPVPGDTDEVVAVEAAAESDEELNEDEEERPNDAVDCPHCSGDGCKHCDDRGWWSLGEGHVLCPNCTGGGEVGSFVFEQECGGCAGTGIVTTERAADLASPGWESIYSCLAMWKEANDSSDLSGVDLSLYDLRDEDLGGQNLVGQDLSGRDMSGVILLEAVLTDVDFSAANLTGADLQRAELAGASLRGATLTGADLEEADLTDADLAGAKLAGAKLVGALLAGADLSNANPEEAASLEGADLTGVTGLTDGQWATCLAKGAILESVEEEA